MRILALFFLLLIFSGCAVQNSNAVLPSQRGQDYKKEEKKESTKTVEKKITPSTGNTTENSVKKTENSSLKKVAESYLGVRYRYGGTTKKGIDCSGFIWRVFQGVGHKEFQRTSSSELYKMGKKVSRSALQLGDLCFFGPGRSVNHVGIYMGNNKFIHASSSKGVTYSSLDNVYWKPRLIGFRRLY